MDILTLKMKYPINFDNGSVLYLEVVKTLGLITH